MAGFWKSKVLPKIKKVFDKTGPKKAAAAEACKAFDNSKEGINKEFEEKKTELQPKVIEIYGATTAEVQTLVKEPKEEDLKKHSVAVHKFLEDLVKIEFPGSKMVCDASTKHGAASVPGPIFFIFEKVSSFIVVEEKPKEAEIPATATEERKTTEETSGEKDKETSATEEKKVEVTTTEEKKEEPKPEVKEEPKAGEKKEEPKTEEKKEQPKTEEKKEQPKTEEKKEASTTTEAPKV